VEAQRLTGTTLPAKCVERLLEAGVGVVALKLGRDGCLIGCPEGVVSVSGFSVDDYDSTGAGDAFAAGIIAGHLSGLPWRSAGLLANAMGALVTSRVGADTSVPRAHEVLRLLRRHLHEELEGSAAGDVRRTIKFVEQLTQRPEEEGKRWWK